MLRSEAYVKLVKRAETLVLSLWSKLEGRVYIILVCTLRVGHQHPRIQPVLVYNIQTLPTHAASLSTDKLGPSNMNGVNSKRRVETIY